MACLKRNEVNGFTLLELLIGIALVALLTTFAVPAIRGWLPDYRLKVAAREFFSVCQSARMAAVERSENCAITFDLPVGGKRYDYVSYVDLNGDFARDTGEEILFAVSLEDYKGVSLDTASGGVAFRLNAQGRPSVAFDPRGTPVAFSGLVGNGTLHLANSLGNVKKIKVNIAGGIRIE